MAEQHPGLDALADLLATDAPDSDPHVATCASCRARLAELSAALVPVAASLASLPLPAAPEDLDRRVTVALDRLRAKERREKAPTVVRPQRRRPPRRLAWLPLAGGLAAAAALVFALVSVDNERPSTGAEGTTTQASTQSNSTGLGYAKDGKLLAEELPALLNGTAAAAPAAASDTSKGSAPRQAAPKADATDQLARLRTSAGLASCLAGVTEGDQLPLALDYARFESQPALVVVLQSTRPDKLDVFVVGAGCTQADAHLLHFTRLARPS